MNVIEVEGLSKDYRQHFWTPVRRVLDSVSFNVKQGEIFGFLGPNGSGKSTTLKILLGIIFATGGKAKLFGEPLGSSAAKAKLGFLPENPYFYDYLTASEFLKFHGELAGVSAKVLSQKISATLALVGMKGTDKLTLRSFSKGMLQRIGLAQAIIHEPQLVILDEPMTGLDPVGRKEVRDLMIYLRDQGKTVFFSTHILSDVETVCDRIAILNKGKLLACGTLDELISAQIQYVDMVWSGLSDSLVKILETGGAKIARSTETLYAKLTVESGEAPDRFENRIQQLVTDGLKSGARLQSLSPKKENLEDVFVRQVGQLESRV